MPQPSSIVRRRRSQRAENGRQSVPQSAQSEWHDRLEFTVSQVTLELQGKNAELQVKGAGR